MTKSLSLLLAVVAGFATVQDASAAQAIGRANAAIAGDLSIFEKQALDFGNLVPGVSGGTVAQTATATTPTGTVKVVNAGQPGIFRVRGSSNTAITLTSPATTTLKQLTGTATMPATLTAPTSATLNAAGEYDMVVTGVLTVAVNQATGQYQSEYTVTANY